MPLTVAEYEIRRSQLKFQVQNLIKDHKKMCLRLGLLEYALGAFLYFTSGWLADSILTPPDWFIYTFSGLIVLSFTFAFAFGTWILYNGYKFEKDTKKQFRSFFENE